MILCCASTGSYGQAKWVNYTNGQQITSLAEDNNSTWVGTSGGLVQIDKTTENKTFYNKANSGIPDNHVTALAFLKGDLWIGTRAGGLAKYTNGVWAVYNIANSKLPSNEVAALKISADTLWIGSKAALIKLDNKGMTVIPKDSARYDAISSIAIDKMNNIWVGFTGSGTIAIAKYDHTKWKSYKPEFFGFQRNFFVYHYSIGIDQNDDKLIGANDGLAYWKTSGITNYTIFNSPLPGSQVNFVLIEGNNKWIGTENGLAAFDGSTWLIDKNIISGAKRQFVSAMLNTTKGPWVGLDEGLSRFTNNQWKFYNTSNSGLTSGSVNAMDNDPNKTTWVGTYNSLVTLKGASWQTPPFGNGVLINSIKSEKNGTVWFCTQTGLIKYDGNTPTTYTSSNSGLPYDDVTCITFAPNGDKWIGTTEGGIAKFDGANKWTVYNAKKINFPYNAIYTIALDLQGNVWASTIGKLIKFDGTSSIEVYGDANTSRPFPIAVDKKGAVWAGTAYGIYQFDGGAMKLFDPALSHVVIGHINNIAIDEKTDEKWMSTDDGLAILKDTAWTVFHADNSPLTSDYTNTITVDAEGNKWIGTAEGISIYNEAGVRLGIDNTGTSTPWKINVYPNPASQKINVSFENADHKEAYINLYNLMGQLVHTMVVSKSDVTSNYEMDITGIPVGIYFVSLEMGGQQLTQKVIINKL
jgi:ligand-binding sensor domain-containing protein